jgi:molybdopterin molybdotransferase
MKPGKPFVCGRQEKRLLFGLPGNPVSAFVTFLLLVRPALLKMSGATNTQLPTHPAVLTAPLVNNGNRRNFMRVFVDAKGRAHPAGMQASHALGSLAKANALVDVPPESTLEEKATVSVLRWAL